MIFGNPEGPALPDFTQEQLTPGRHHATIASANVEPSKKNDSFNVSFLLSNDKGTAWYRLNFKQEYFSVPFLNLLAKGELPKNETTRAKIALRQIKQLLIAANKGNSGGFDPNWLLGTNLEVATELRYFDGTQEFRVRATKKGTFKLIDGDGNSSEFNSLKELPEDFSQEEAQAEVYRVIPAVLAGTDVQT